MGGHPNLRAPQPTPQAPHARLLAQSLGDPSCCWPGVAVLEGMVASAGQILVPGRAAQVQCAPPEEGCGCLALLAVQSEREAQLKAGAGKGS